MSSWRRSCTSILILLLMLLIGCIGREGPTIEYYLGIWEAVEEGTPPDRSIGEEPSKLIILLDSGNKINVFIAYRNAERRIIYTYGIARLEKGILRFRDQTGFPFKIVAGEDITYGKTAGVWLDFPGSEADMGEYKKISTGGKKKW